MKMIFSIKQINKIQSILKNLEVRLDVKEFDVLYNPLLPKEPIVRYKCVYTSVDGGVGMDIYYRCIDRNGNESDCMAKYGDSIYLMLKDYTIIRLSDPNIEIL